MKVLVLGATGGTGLCVVAEALERGCDVIALVRSPDKLTVQHERLKTVKGDVTSSTDISSNLIGCDAVLCAVGGRPSLFDPCDIYSSTVKAAALAMKESGINRFVCVTAWGTKDDPRLPFIWRWMMKPTVMRHVVADMLAMEEYLATDHCAHLNYTVVRPPKLMNTPSSGAPLRTEEGQAVTNDAVGKVSRVDLAKFMLDCLETRDWDRKLVAVVTS